MTTDELLLALLNIGIKTDELETFSVGMLLDLLTTKSNLHYKSNKGSNGNSVRQATQRDFDNF